MPIIPLTESSVQEDWRMQMRGAVRSVSALANLLELPQLTDVETTFPLLVPHAYVNRMVKGDPNDPLLRQVLPVADENQVVSGYSTDPVGELTSQTPGQFLAKYRGRVLAVATGSCAVNCRYCFRRHFPYSDFQSATADWQKGLDSLSSDTREIILSGGDPLILSDAKLGNILDMIAQTQVSTVRIHTRTPVVIPRRITDELVELLVGMNERGKQVVMVLHTNHANEIDGDYVTAMRALKTAGITLLNQSVLLRGVNDSSTALTDLSNRLWDAGVLPYYLHLLDKVAGAAHFDVEECHAVELIDSITRELPGYLVPKLVREIDGEPSKIHISA